jgi:hypothetical protein
MMIDSMTAVDSGPGAQLIAQLEGAVALAQRTGQAIAPHTLVLMINAMKETLRIAAIQAPAPPPAADPTMFAGGTQVDAISASATMSASEKSGLRAFLSRYGLPTPPVGQGYSHSKLNEILASKQLPTHERATVKSRLVACGLVSLNAA